jgi:hypothetical protein
MDCIWKASIVQWSLEMKNERGRGQAAIMPNIATVCINGNTAKYLQNSCRLNLLSEVVKQINKRWEDLDAIVFPGGFLRLNENIGSLPYSDRVKGLAEFDRPLKKAAASMTRSSDGLIITGIDGPTRPKGGDQLCVAWGRTGVVGIGRKVFPTGGVDGESHDLVCYQSDYGDPHRVISLPCGRTAILCACYDMFGVAERKRETIRTKSILRIASGNIEYRTHRTPWKEFHQIRRECLRQWRDLLAAKNVTVGIAAIHYFEGHSTTYWQKHGIASCSASLGHGFAVGAAHFGDGLPYTQNSSTLAACRVPEHHLKQGEGRYRKPHSWKPTDGFEFGNSNALVRLYS